MEQNDDEIDFYLNHIRCRPILLYDVKKLFTQVEKAYDYLRTSDEKTKAILEPVIHVACDEACNMSYEFGFKYPEDLADNPYYVFLIKDL